MTRVIGFVALGLLVGVSVTLFFRGSGEQRFSSDGAPVLETEAAGVRLPEERLEEVVPQQASEQDTQAVIDEAVEAAQEPSGVDSSARNLESVSQSPPSSFGQAPGAAQARAQGLGAEWPEIESTPSPESDAMENEILNFLSRYSDLGITSITDVHCDARNCKFQLTGLDQVPVPTLMRELMAEESMALTDARFRFMDPSLGFDSIELLISYDSKAVSETRTTEGRGSGS